MKEEKEMKIKLILSITVLVIIAVVILGSAGYVYAHPNTYSKDVREERHMKKGT
jgi:heme/copper-type cytochrome/quinol oxidase subunit 4